MAVEQASRVAGVRRAVMYWFDPAEGPVDHLIARWLFLRALGLIYFSAFLALLYQVRGLIGTQGILPAGEFLQALHQTRAGCGSGMRRRCCGSRAAIGG